MRKVKVPKPISIKIGGFPLTRPIYLKILVRIHNEIARDYEKNKHFRSAHDDRFYMHKMVIRDNPEKHLFRFAIDDSTSPDDLIIVDIGHSVRG